MRVGIGWATLLLFTLSGACGLSYQVLWVRQLSLIFGVTTWAMAVVISSFMGGLAIGALLAARLAPRITSPLRVYGGLELLIALCAALMPTAVAMVTEVYQALVPLSASPMVGVLVQGVLVGALLLVPTACMGATLPLLARTVLDPTQPAESHAQGGALGRLYGLNTLGALAGTLFCGFYALEHLGLTRTNHWVVALNVLAGALAIGLGSRASTGQRAEVELRDGQADGTSALPEKAHITSHPPPSPWSPRLILGMAGLSGFTSLAYEVVWTRLMGQAVLTTSYVFSMVLATVIAGLGFGSLLGAPIADRVRRPQVWFGVLELIIALWAFLLGPMTRALAVWSPQTLEEQYVGFFSVYGRIALLVMGVALVPSLCMGATFPVLARLITQGKTDPTGPVGRMYAANTLGCILGSLAGAFLLLPFLGIFHALSLLGALNLAMALYAAWPRENLPAAVTSPPAAESAELARAQKLGLIGALVCCGVAALPLGAPPLETLFRARLPEGSQMLALREGIASSVMVADVSEPKVRRIWINSAWVAGTGGSHKMLGHLPLLMFGRSQGGGPAEGTQQPNPKDVLGIAFGTGQSFGTTLLHGVESIDCVDLNPDMVALGGEYFAGANHGLLKDARAQIHILDGRDFVARTQKRFDAVIMEPLQPWSAGAVNLYTREFYQSLHRVLRPGGLVAQWLPIDDLDPEVTRSIIGTFSAEFPYTYIFLDNYDLWFVGAKEPQMLDISLLQQRLAIPAVQADLLEIEYPDLASILATCILGPEEVRAYTRQQTPLDAKARDCGQDVPCLTDDRPFLDYVAPRTMGGAWLRKNLDTMRPYVQFPTTFLRKPPGQETSDPPLPPALLDGRLGRLWMDGALAADEGQPAAARAYFLDAWTMAPGVGRALTLLRDETVTLARSLQQAGKAAEALELYQSHLKQDPTFAGGWFNLGLLQARAGQKEAARAAWQQALQDPTFGHRVHLAEQRLEGR